VKKDYGRSEKRLRFNNKLDLIVNKVDLLKARFSTKAVVNETKNVFVISIIPYKRINYSHNSIVE
jgi:hypothetical protein